MRSFTDDIRVGFTGTQRGMTAEQKLAVAALMTQLQPAELHHGDCIGADMEVAQMMRRRTRIVQHPPTDTKKRAFTTFGTIRPAAPYRERNAAIVTESDVLIATPKGMKEELRSGTWMTIRMARRQKKPVYIVWPDGHVENV